MVLAIIAYYFIAGLYALYTLRKYFITPCLVFVGMQTLMFTGILTYSDFNISSDCKLVLIYLLALIMFIIGSKFSSMVNGKNVSNAVVLSDEDSELSSMQKFYLILMLGVGIILCAYFFMHAGYNVFLQILVSIGSSSNNNFTNSRIAMNNISGVGYIYQFRVVIVPLITAFLLTCKNNKNLQKIGMICFPIMIMFVLGTGQRGGFVMFILMWAVALLYMYYFYREEKMKKTLITIVVLALFLFAIMTIFNGRVASDGNVIQAMLQRIFDDNQQCAVIAFRYIDSQPIQWGKDWYLSILDILPGKNSYLQLSYVIFGIMYGSTRGTAPPCIWGSCFYNWGWLGIILFPFIMGFCYHKLYCSFAEKPVTQLRIYVFSAMFVVLGNWIADTPLVLFNQGFITLCLMRLLLVPNRALAVSGKRITG